MNYDSIFSLLIQLYTLIIYGLSFYLTQKWFS